jgi:protein-disulfide isomerase
MVVDGGLRSGPDEAPVVVVEFGDYECPFCRESASFVRRLRTTFPETAFVYRHLPLPIHRHAYFAARVSECAADQDRWEAAHDFLMRSADLSTLDVVELGREAEIPSLEKFDECVRRDDPVARVEEDMALAERLEITWTPAFAINGTLYPHALDSATLYQIVESTLGASQAGK